jgi:hypothetical protein
MSVQYIYLVVFFIIAYLIIADANVAAACVYIFDIIKNKIKGNVWWMMNNPRNPVVKYLMWRRAMKMAKELEKEFRNDKLR